MTTQESFYAITYTFILNVLEFTVHYFTVGHYLQSRRHKCRLLSLSRRGTHSQEGQSLETAARNKVMKESTTEFKTVWDCLPLSR